MAAASAAAGLEMWNGSSCEKRKRRKRALEGGGVVGIMVCVVQACIIWVGGRAPVAVSPQRVEAQSGTEKEEQNENNSRTRKRRVEGCMVFVKHVCDSNVSGVSFFAFAVQVHGQRSAASYNRRRS